MKAKLQGDKILTKIERQTLTKLGYYCDHKRAHKFFSLMSKQDERRRVKEGTWGNPDFGFHALLLKTHGHVVATCQNTKIPYKTVAEVCTDKVTVYEGDDVDGALAAIDGFMAIEKAKRALNPEHYERVDPMAEWNKKAQQVLTQSAIQMGKSMMFSKAILEEAAAAMELSAGTLMSLSNLGKVKPAEPGDNVIGIVTSTKETPSPDGLPTLEVSGMAFEPYGAPKYKPAPHIFADELYPPKDEQK